MKKLLFILLVLGVIAIVGCAPVQPGTSREGALAGKAILVSSTNVAVDSCSATATGIEITSGGVSGTLTNSCDAVSNQGTRYSCSISGVSYSEEVLQCEEGESCINGDCVANICEPGCSDTQLINRTIRDGRCMLLAIPEVAFTLDGSDFEQRYGSVDCRRTVTGFEVSSHPSFEVFSNLGSRATCVEVDEISAGGWGPYNRCVLCGAARCRQRSSSSPVAYYAETCPSGWELLDFVACDTPSTQLLSCSDTDELNNVRVTGELTQEFADGNIFRYSDHCSIFNYAPGSVTQGRCTDDFSGSDDGIRWTESLCPSGTTCREGACV